MGSGRGSEALRDLVRAREAAKQDQLRARHRLSKFLLRSGQRPAAGLKAWTQLYMAWVRQLRFEQAAQNRRGWTIFTRWNTCRAVVRLEQAIAEAVKLASPEIQEVVKDLQALRGIAQISAVTIAAELGNISRFESARQLMGYSGAVPREDSSGKRTQRGSITKTGNAHLRRIVVEAAWSYRLRQASDLGCASDKKACRKSSRRWPGRRRIDCTSATPGWRRRARTSARSSPQWDANCWASFGLSESRRRRPPSSAWRPDEEQKQRQRQKQKLSKE